MVPASSAVLNVSLKGLGIQEQTDFINHGKLSLIIVYLVVLKKIKQGPEIC